MDYNSPAPLQRQRIIYMCNICHSENKGYIARNNHSRNHPNNLPTYTIMNNHNSQNKITSNPNIHVEHHLSLNNPTISNVDYNGDTNMEDASMDTGSRLIPYHCYQHYV